MCQAILKTFYFFKWMNQTLFCDKTEFVQYGVDDNSGFYVELI